MKKDEARGMTSGLGGREISVGSLLQNSSEKMRCIRGKTCAAHQRNLLLSVRIQIN